MKKKLLIIPLLSGLFLLAWLYMENPRGSAPLSEGADNKSASLPTARLAPERTWAHKGRASGRIDFVPWHFAEDPQKISKGLKQMLHAYRSGQRNVDFDLRIFVEGVLAQDERTLIRVHQYLLSIPQVNTDHVTKEQSDAILRMSAIDLLEAAAALQVTIDSAEESLSALKYLVSYKIQRDIDDAQRKVLVAEKLEAMEALARVDPGMAAQAYCDSKLEQRALLARSIRAALVDRGISRVDVGTRFAELTMSITGC